MTTSTPFETNKYWRLALGLTVFTIVYNLAEGVVSIFFGVQDKTLTLFGFGVDSFIEVLSGIGILAMILRIRSHPETDRSVFEKTALRITGTSFYILAAGLAVTAILNLVTRHKPETTLAGVIISLISIAIMWALVWSKRKAGRALDSAPILADANCTMVCIYMSLVLLASSLIYQLTGLGFIDSLGSIGLIYFSFKEGKESFEKANNLSCDCDED